MRTTAQTLLFRFRNAASSSSRAFSSSAAESDIYKRALKLQRPTTVKYQENLRNSVSLIGVIELPLEKCKTSGGFGFYTLLRVNATAATSRYFNVRLKFWNEMAEMSVQHLKPRDFVYVSGHLRSYGKVDGDGKYWHNYEVNVLEINFVAQHGLGPSDRNSSQLESQVSSEDVMERHRARLHLWQIFFANPYEWWDNRNHKLYSSSPDFRHKDTGEKLWLKDNDPPWIKHQLQLHDFRSSKQNRRESGNDWLCLSPLVYHDAKRS